MPHDHRAEESPFRPLPHTPLQKECPQKIAEALLKAVEAVEAATKTGKLDRAGFAVSYHQLGDIYEVCHKALIDEKLIVKPVELGCEETVMPDGISIRAVFSYKFRIIHNTGTWTDEEDIRRVPVWMGAENSRYGAAQTMALREFYKGLFRIRDKTEDNGSGAQKGRDLPGKPVALREGANPEGGIFFEFEQGHVEPYDPKEVFDAFLAKVASLPGEQVLAWAALRVNVEGLKALQATSSRVWKKIKEVIDVHQGDGA